MATSTLLQLVILSTFFVLASAFSNLRTCTDGNCARSNRTIDMLNDYRNTTCKPLNVMVGGSFQIVQLDPGCNVTLYGASSSGVMCSSGQIVAGHVETCYSSSWVYYAIDGCKLSTSSATSWSSTAASSTPPPGNSKDRNRDPQRDGIIAGTVVAAMSATALLFTGVLVLMRQRSKFMSVVAHELSNHCALVETSSVEKQPAKELWGGHAAVEIGRNSQSEPSEEIPVQRLKD